MRELVQQFVNSFQKAVRLEMDAMREQLGPYEVPVSKPNEVETPADSEFKLYEVTTTEPSDKLVLNVECTLVHDTGETLVTITAIDGDRLTLRSTDEFPPDASSWTLVIYPWFLYERLLQTLETLPASPDFHATSAMTLFGKLAPVICKTPKVHSRKRRKMRNEKILRLLRLFAAQHPSPASIPVSSAR